MSRRARQAAPLRTHRRHRGVRHKPPQWVAHLDRSETRTRCAGLGYHSEAECVCAPAERKPSGATSMPVIQRMIGLAGVSVALFVFVFYAIVMTPDTALADSWPGYFSTGEVYFVYEDHIGRPVLMSEYDDYDSDGSYFTDSEGGDPFWQVNYKPFGMVSDNYSSQGIDIGNTAQNGIVWSMPFRFPGQYADKEFDESIFYNWHRYYIPHIGRYNRADPYRGSFNSFSYVMNNPDKYVDPKGLKPCKSGKCADCANGDWRGFIEEISAKTLSVLPESEFGLGGVAVRAFIGKLWCDAEDITIAGYCYGTPIVTNSKFGDFFKTVGSIGVSYISCSSGFCMEDFLNNGSGFSLSASVEVNGLVGGSGGLDFGNVGCATIGFSLGFGSDLSISKCVIDVAEVPY